MQYRRWTSSCLLLYVAVHTAQKNNFFLLKFQAKAIIMRLELHKKHRQE